MPTENDIIQNHEARLVEFYVIYADAVQEYEDAKAEALSSFDQIRQDILAEIAGVTSEILAQIDQQISSVAAAYEQAKYDTTLYVIGQIQEITTLHEEALVASQILYQTTNEAVTQTHQEAIEEFQANAERVKSLVDERESDIQAEIAELFTQFTTTTNNIHAAFLNEVEQQNLNKQTAITRFTDSRFSTLAREVNTRSFIAARIRAKNAGEAVGDGGGEDEDEEP